MRCFRLAISRRRKVAPRDDEELADEEAIVTEFRSRACSIPFILAARKKVARVATLTSADQRTLFNQVVQITGRGG